MWLHESTSYQRCAESPRALAPARVSGYHVGKQSDKEDSVPPLPLRPLLLTLVPAGPKGDPGTSITALEALNGLACHSGARDGTVSLAYDAAGKAVFTCTTPPVTSAVRLNEFSTGTTTAATDEFVELVNPGASAE